MAALDGIEQVWTGKGWAVRFALPLDPSDTGYGHDPQTVALVTGDAASLLGYFEDAHEKTLAFVRSLDESGLSRVVDRSWDPPATVSMGLVNIIVDDLQHVGQAAYVRGILQRQVLS